MAFSEAGLIPSVDAHAGTSVLPSDTEQAETSLSPEIGDLWESRDGLHLVRVARIENSTVTVEYRTKNAHGDTDVDGGKDMFMSLEDFLREYQVNKKVQNKPAATVVNLSDYLSPRVDREPATEQGRYEADIETTRAALLESVKAILTSIEQSMLKRKDKRPIQQKASMLLDLATPKDSETDATVEEFRTALREADELLEKVKESPQKQQESQEPVVGGSIAGVSLDALIHAQAIARPASEAEPVVSATPIDKSTGSGPLVVSESSSSDVSEPQRKGNGGGSGDGGDGGNGDHLDIEKEFKAFLERPDGKEIVDTYKMIIKGERQYFTQAISRTQKYLSFNEKIDVWENDEQMLPAILAQLSKDLTQKRSVTRDQASAILRVVLGQLHTEFLDKQEEKRKQNQGAK